MRLLTSAAWAIGLVLYGTGWLTVARHGWRRSWWWFAAATGVGVIYAVVAGAWREAGVFGGVLGMNLWAGLRGWDW